MNVALEFFRTVLKQHYGQEFDELLPQFADDKDLVALRMREPSNDSELENLKKLGKVHPLGALLSAIAYLERTLLQFGAKVGIGDESIHRASWMPISGRYLEANGIQLPQGLRERLENTRRLRNLAAHGRAEPTREDVIAAISSIEELERFLAGLNVETAKEQVALARNGERQRNPSTTIVGSSCHQINGIYEVLKNFLMTEPSLGNKKFMIDVRDGKVSVSRLPDDLPGTAKVFQYKFSLNERGNNISIEADRIKMQILKDCLSRFLEKATLPLLLPDLHMKTLRAVKREFKPGPDTQSSAQIHQLGGANDY